MTLRKAIRKRQARRIARFQAGLIIEAVLNDGWGPDDLARKYGPDALEEIRNGLLFISAWLIDTGHRDGGPKS